MTVESNYVIAIATLNDWLKRLAPVFQLMRSQTKTNRTMYAWYSRALSKFQIIARNCDWFIVLFAPVVIGRSNCVGFGFSTVVWKLLFSNMTKFKGSTKNKSFPILLSFHSNLFFCFLFSSQEQYVNLMRGLHHRHLDFAIMKNTTMLSLFILNHFMILKFLYYAWMLLMIHFHLSMVSKVNFGSFC